MTPDQREWSRTRDELIDAVTFLGFPKELGDAMAGGEPPKKPDGEPPEKPDVESGPRDGNPSDKPD